jgi:hypothetical protein
LPCRPDRPAGDDDAMDSDGAASGRQMNSHRARIPRGGRAVPGVRCSPHARGVRLLSLAGPGRSGPLGTGQRLGPDHVWVPWVERKDLIPGALAPRPVPLHPNLLHRLSSPQLASGYPRCSQGDRDVSRRHNRGCR